MSVMDGRYTVAGTGPWTVVDWANPEKHGELYRDRADAERAAEKAQRAVAPRRAHPVAVQPDLFETTEEV